MDLDQVPRCGGINLCCGVVRSEPGGWSIFILLLCLPSIIQTESGLQVYRSGIKQQVEAYMYCMLLNWVILSPETWLSIIWQKKLSTVFVEIKLCMTVVVLSYFIGWNLTFLVCWKIRYVIICFCFFQCSNCGNDTFCIANSWLILKFDHGWIWLSLIDIIDMLRCRI